MAGHALPAGAGQLIDLVVSCRLSQPMSPGDVIGLNDDDIRNYRLDRLVWVDTTID